ncbi:PREDICTED: small G protein signaling modulator 1-like isoform X2 [Nelumbo nucifera]|uniref:Small G protein signaling modulator 1-like isoform X2 n=1 Tax=Nelumbo nucifera TaxID=4432 RepID=A0A1U8Q0K3_NELNU|nr:PREDICTED: small G protein signaling modulator 1-like isoform X2 [Nelumbo nucifera]
MSLDEEDKQWTCVKAGTVNLQLISSIVRDIREPCLHSPTKGVDPSIRAEVWEFLLGCYSLGSTADYRRRLRMARRDRYMDLIKQCQMMHSSIGTGSLAYVVGSKVMDMRTVSKESGKREAEGESRQDFDDTTNEIETYCDCNNNHIDTSYTCQGDSSSDSADIISIMGSTDGAVYDSSCPMPSSGPYNCFSPMPGEEAHVSKYINETYFDFPPLPVTDLFEQSDRDKKESELHNDRLSADLRWPDENMHSFQISNNIDLIMESNGSPSDGVSHARNPETEMATLDIHREEVKEIKLECKTEAVNGLRISDVQETIMMNATMTQEGSVSEDRVSEWLWTLHQIVVDVVRTDSNLEFYEDAKNLARLSDILAVYAWVDPATGYCQGMSDLLSPFVVLYEDNADAFWCFEMLLRRMRENFQTEGPAGVIKQLQALWNILELTDREMFAHLSQIGAESLHFAFRMLLVLFRRELSFNEVLCMWEMMWAADFDESVARELEDHCLEPLVVLLPKDSGTETGDESAENGNGSSIEGLHSKHGSLERSLSDASGMKSVSSRPFCGLTRNFWSRNARMQICTVVSSTKEGDDELPVFCVAAILIINRQKIIKATHSIDDMIKIFNDKMLKINVKRCIRTAIKLRKKYLYKLMKVKSLASSEQ